MNPQLMIKVNVKGYIKPFYYTKPLSLYPRDTDVLNEFIRVHKFQDKECTIVLSQIQGTQNGKDYCNRY